MGFLVTNSAFLKFFFIIIIIPDKMKWRQTNLYFFGCFGGQITICVTELLVLPLEILVYSIWNKGFGAIKDNMYI